MWTKLVQHPRYLVRQDENREGYEAFHGLIRAASSQPKSHSWDIGWQFQYFEANSTVKDIVTGDPQFVEILFSAASWRLTIELDFEAAVIAASPSHQIPAHAAERGERAWPRVL